VIEMNNNKVNNILNRMPLATAGIVHDFSINGRGLS